MVSSHHQIISHFHAEMHRSLDTKTASSSFRSSWEMLMQQARTQQHSWALEFQAKVQAPLCPITKQPWASTVAPRSPKFSHLQNRLYHPNTGSFQAPNIYVCCGTQHTVGTQIQGPVRAMSPPPQLAVRSNKLLILACVRNCCQQAFFM